jgi:hypothetical protein
MISAVGTPNLTTMDLFVGKCNIGRVCVSSVRHETEAKERNNYGGKRSHKERISHSENADY